MPRRFQYPRTAFTPPNGSGFKETPQVDKWLPQYPDIVRKLPRTAYFESTFWDPNTKFPEQVFIDKWAPVYPDKIYARPRAAYFEPSFQDPNVSFPESVFIDKWAPVYPDYINARPRNPAALAPYFTTAQIVDWSETIYADKWQPVYPERVPSRPRAHALSLSANAFQFPVPTPPRAFPGTGIRITSTVARGQSETPRPHLSARDTTPHYRQ
jgi:hypothetical protein